MIYFKIIELDKNDLARLHDVIFNVFEVSVTDSQIQKLFKLTEIWDGDCDTLGLSEFMDCITKYFINMKLPMYGSSKEYKDKFWSEIERAKPNFIQYINENS